MAPLSHFSDNKKVKCYMRCTGLIGPLRAIRALVGVLSHLALCIPLRVFEKVDCFTL
jgi:hypothetical protein